MHILSSLFSLFFFGLPLAAIIFFVFSLVRYLQAKIQNKKSGEPFSVYSRDEIKKRLTLLIISIIVAIAEAAVITGVILLLLNGLAYM